MHQIWFIPRLMVALYRMSWDYAILIAVYTIIEGLIRIAMPLVLIFLLDALEKEDRDTAYIWAAVISALGVSQTIVHHILFFFTIRMGWNWKTASTAFIYQVIPLLITMSTMMKRTNKFILRRVYSISKAAHYNLQ